MRESQPLRQFGQLVDATPLQSSRSCFSLLIPGDTPFTKGMLLPLLRSTRPSTRTTTFTPSRLSASLPQQQTRMFALTPYRHDQPRTLSRQKELPRLPIPKLELSLDRYLKSLRPFLLQQALEKGQGEESVEKELKKRKEWAEDFTKQGGLGRLLQERLKGQSSCFLSLLYEKHGAGEG